MYQSSGTRQNQDQKNVCIQPPAVAQLFDELLSTSHHLKIDLTEILVINDASF